MRAHPARATVRSTTSLGASLPIVIQFCCTGHGVTGLPTAHEVSTVQQSWDGHYFNNEIML